MRIGPSLPIGSGQAHRAIVRCTDWAAIALPTPPPFLCCGGVQARAEEALKNGKTEADFTHAEDSLKRAETRLEVAGKS
jgi:ATP synthase, Delta/Epsilon chain, long alpha-helix domain